MPHIFQEFGQGIGIAFDSLARQCGQQFPDFNFSTLEGNPTRMVRNPTTPSTSSSFLHSNLGSGSSTSGQAASFSEIMSQQLADSTPLPVTPIPLSQNPNPVVVHQDLPMLMDTFTDASLKNFVFKITSLHASAVNLPLANLIPPGTMARNTLLSLMSFHKICSEIEFFNSLSNVDTFLKYMTLLLRCKTNKLDSRKRN